MPTLFGFSARKVLTRASRGLLALCLAATAVTAGAAQNGLDPHLVNADDVSAAKNLMLQNPKKAPGALRDLKDRLVRYGLTDSLATVQNVHWLYAQAWADVDCVAAYRALYQSAALGFVADAPRRAEVYQKRENELKQCLPENAQDRVEKDAWRELRESPLRDSVNIQNVHIARAGQSPTPAPEQAASAESASTGKSEEKSPINFIKSIEDTVFTIMMLLVVVTVAISIFKVAVTGDSSTTSSSAAPAPAKPSNKASATAKRTPTASSTQAHHPSRATKNRRVGLVRVRPWD